MSASEGNYILQIPVQRSMPIVIPSNNKIVEGTLSPNQYTQNSPETRSIEFLRDLGTGQFGYVWLGKMSVSQRYKNVAVKDFGSGGDRELAVVENLLHEKPQGVPRIYGLLQTPYGSPHILMKYCNEGATKDFFNNHINDKIICYQRLIQILHVLHEFHAAGYCHRDIHEGNFLAHRKKETGEVVIYIVDFGHANKIGAQFPQIPPIHDRPLFMVNSPRELCKLYFEADKKSNYDDYNQYLDQYGFAIDLHQTGMMIFRVAVSESAPILYPPSNKDQENLITYLDQLLGDPSKDYDVEDYLASHHPNIPESVRQVIAGLLRSNEPMPLIQAIEILENTVG